MKTECYTPEISVAPMMEWTDRHCRYFHRLLAPHARLYTEMLTTGAILRGDRERFLRFDPAEHPVALQLGGSDPAALAECAAIGEEHGYDEINLNCGCPSDKVQSGRFGACLMKEPELVAACVKAMVRSVKKIPVTVKCRIGVDERDSPEFLFRFVEKAADAGCKTFIIHARKALLKGLSPKENREVPPLMYDRARAVKDKYPALRIILNGGIKNIEQIVSVLSPRKRGPLDISPEDSRFCGKDTEHTYFDGVMIGREAYQNPWFLREIESSIFNAPSPVLACARTPSPTGRGSRDEVERGEGLSREIIALKMHSYAREQYRLHGTPVKSITRHMLGLYHGQPRGKIWRRALSSLPYEPGADESVILRALEMVEDQKLAA